jgi:Ca-activated chloride channel family protein
MRVQLQFMPAFVASYRLIGYDSPPVVAKKTEGGLAAGWSFPAGQTITALYEVVPASPSKPAVSDARPNKAQRTSARDLIAADDSIVTLVVRLRYQRPGAQAYWLLEAPWTDPGQSFDSASRDFRFAAAVAAFGMTLRGSQYRGDISLETIERIADSARGEDRQRTEFVDLVRLARQLGAGR